jgi:hypothetical protein
VLAAALATHFSGCKKKEVAETAPEEAPAATPPPAATTPAPKPVAAATPKPIPATPAPELAPPGIFYLVTAVSVETSDGIFGLKPGQLLRLVRPGVYRADNNEVTLRPDQVTNDLTIARRLANQDKQTQAAIQQRLAPQPVPAVATTGSNPQSQPSARPPAPQEDPKLAARNEIFRQKQVLTVEINRVAATMSQLSTKYGGNWDAAARKSPQVFQLLQQYNGLMKQQTDLDAQMAAIR